MIAEALAMHGQLHEGGKNMEVGGLGVGVLMAHA